VDIVSEGLKYQYHTAWPVVLGVLSVLAQVSTSTILKICSKLLDLNAFYPVCSSSFVFGLMFVDVIIGLKTIFIFL
jgi:hypothetical protein